MPIYPDISELISHLKTQTEILKEILKEIKTENVAGAYKLTFFQVSLAQANVPQPISQGSYPVLSCIIQNLSNDIITITTDQNQLDGFNLAPAYGAGDSVELPNIDLSQVYFVGANAGDKIGVLVVRKI